MSAAPSPELSATSLGEISRATAASMPLLVYGTLRPGEPNHWLIEERARVMETVRIEGYRLLDNGGWFPYAVPTTTASSDSSIVCDVVNLFSHHAGAVLRDLDRLEGYVEGNPASLYRRQEVVYMASDGVQRRGWMYVPSAATMALIQHLPGVHGGDWLRRGSVRG